jgi:methylenetetrahydrofolate reductase (NADPH)
VPARESQAAVDRDDIPDQVSRGHAAVLAALARPRFELVPIAGVVEQARLLPPLSTVTITSSPKRGNEHTLDVAEQLLRLGLRPVPHIAARLVTGEAQLRELLRRAAELGLDEFFVVGGDTTTPEGPYGGALDLLREMERIGHHLRRIGVAGYPEGHPLVGDDTLLHALLKKQRYATYLVTQITFDPDAIGRWLGEIRRQGVELPAHIGLPGSVDGARLLRISMKIGVGQSMRYLSRHTGLAGRLLRRGGYRPDALLEGLAPYFGDPECRIAGLHFNTFNQVASTEEWRMRKLREGGAS